MYRMSVLLFALPPSFWHDMRMSLDTCLKMCLIHDMAEAMIGDVTPLAKMSKEEKFQREQTAITHLDKLILQSWSADDLVTKNLRLPPLSAIRCHLDIASIWLAYEQKDTKEACLVKDLDRFDLILQAYQYECAFGDLDLQHYFDATMTLFKTPLIASWAQDLADLRAHLLKK
jgi:putative hydrolases of HD superfamily